MKKSKSHSLLSLYKERLISLAFIAIVTIVIIEIFTFNDTLIAEEDQREMTENRTIQQEKIIPQQENIPKDISILFFGDLIYDRHVYLNLPNSDSLKDHFLYRYDKTIDYKGEKLSFKDISQEFDFVGLNLESSIGKFWSGDKEKNICLKTGKGISFCSHEDILPVLKELGFTTVNLANNHVMDAGVRSHLKTVELLEKYGINYFGFVSQGSYFEKNYVYTGEKYGQKFARHGYDYTVRQYLHQKYCDDLKLYKKNEYTNFVVVHRGPEYTDKHSKYQGEIANKLLACGADVIFGGHPHVIQDTATYSGKVVFYSLGNFLFDQYFEARTQLGGYAIIDYYFDGREPDIYTGTIPAGAKRKDK